MTIDEPAARRNFARRAAGYDDHAFLIREVDRRMLSRMEFVNLDPKRILDLGCGTGGSLTALTERYPGADIVGADAVFAMLDAGKRERKKARWVLPFLRKVHRVGLACADARSLPFADGCFDLIWSNLMVHWIEDPGPVFAEAARTLREGGLFMFSAFGPDTLKELRTAGFSTHTFIDMHDLGDALVRHGFGDPVMAMELVVLTYKSFDHLLAELRGAGGASACCGRARGLLGKRQWRERLAAFETLCSGREEGRLAVTFEIVYGHAWKVSAQQTPHPAGEAPIHFYLDKHGPKS